MAKGKKEDKGGKKGSKGGEIIPITPTEGGASYEHKKTRKDALKLRDKAEESYWELSRVLYEIHQNSYYQAWGYEHWKDYIDQEIGWDIRKTQYLLNLREKFKDLPDNVVEWVKQIGWTKARMIISRLTPENAAEWRARIEGKTVAEIQELFKQLSESGEGGSGGSGEGDEKFGRLVVSGIYPDLRKSIDAAFPLAEKITGSEKKAYQLDCILTEFLSAQMATKDARDYWKQVERFTGCRILVYDPETDKIPYGFDLIKEMEEKEATGEVDTEVDEDEGDVDITLN